MANITSVRGTLTLKGDWSKEAVDAFLPVLDSWQFYDEYGFQSHGPLGFYQPSTDFSGCGRWSFSGVLDSLDEWTRDWIETNPDSDHPLTSEQYQLFLKRMEENDLSIWLEFDDEDFGNFEIHESGTLSVEENRLNYDVYDRHDIEHDWKDFDRSHFDKAVEFFQKWNSVLKIDIPKATKESIQKWVLLNISPVEDFELYIGDFQYEHMEGELTQLQWTKEDEAWYNAWPSHTQDDKNTSTSSTYPLTELSELDFTGKFFAFTGIFAHGKENREEVAKLIEAKGGKYMTSVTLKTDFLVVGSLGGVDESQISLASIGKKRPIISETTLFKFL